MNFVTILLLTALEGYVVVKSEDRNEVYISPGYDLQDYLCNGRLRSGTTLILGFGQHRLSSGALCSASNISNIMLLGSNDGDTTIQGDVEFAMVQNLTIEKASFDRCTVFLQSSIRIYFRHCTFQSNTQWYSITAESSGDIEILNCTFANVFPTDGIITGALRFAFSTFVTTISGCTFQDYINGANLVSIINSNGRMCITNCSFQISGFHFAIWITESHESINIMDCVFKNNIGPLIYIELSGPIKIADCMFQNNDLARIKIHSSDDVNISNCTFQDNFNDKALIEIFNSSGGIYIADCKFLNNGVPYVVALMIEHIAIIHCSFQVNYVYQDAYEMIAITQASNKSIAVLSDNTFREKRDNETLSSLSTMIMCGYGSIHLANSTFENIGNIIGMVDLNSSTAMISITNCTFRHVRLSVSSENTSIMISDSTFQYIFYPLTVDLTLSDRSTVHILHCTFEMNHAQTGGALVVYEEDSAGTLDVTIMGCTFRNNKAAIGGALLIVSPGTFHIVNSIFDNNIASEGAAIMVANNPDRVYPAARIRLCKLFLVDVVIQNNSCDGENNYAITRGGAISFIGAIVKIRGTARSGSHFVSNGPQGAIQGINGYLKLRGKVTFDSNSGENGGAITLLNVDLLFAKGCNVSFVANTASRLGGAIYIEGKQSWSLQPDIERVEQYCHIFVEKKGCVSFRSNQAQLAGHAIYATTLYDCYFSDESNSSLSLYQSLFDTKMQLDSQIVSAPIKVLICGKNSSNNIESYNVSIYPGGTVQLNVTTVDYERVLSPSAVYAQINGNGMQNFSLQAQLNVQWVGKECTTLKYQIYGPEMTSLNLQLSSYPGNAPTLIKVILLPCVTGFILSSDAYTCVCSAFLNSAIVDGVVCDATFSSVSRDGTQWIGVYMNENKFVPAIASVCPLNYCRNITKISLAEPDALCEEGRTGTLCGHCLDGLSVVFGSSQCQNCSNMWLITILMYAILGVLLVVILCVLNLTVAQGTVYGLIFYANIVQINDSIFFNQSEVSRLQIMISLINLDLGFPLCFYNGMDDTAKIGLQFVFPTYIITLTITVIVAFHYCLCQNTESGRCLNKLSYLVGQRAVGVLATLIYLSFSKLLRTVIDVFAFSTLSIPDGSVHIWFYDGNIKYLQGKHAILFAIAIGTSVLFLLPYTLALTIIPVIEKYSEHNRLFIYLYNIANRVKPMNDVYFAPYKGEWRFWLGARLWLLIFLYIINPVYSHNEPKLLLFIHTVMVTLFMLMQSHIKPFVNSMQKTNAPNRIQYVFGELYNWLDLFYLLNYAMLSLSLLYISSQQKLRKQINNVVGVLIGLYGVLLVATVLYHTILFVLIVCRMHERIQKKISDLIFPKIQSHSMEMHHPADTHRNAASDVLNEDRDNSNRNLM